MPSYSKERISPRHHQQQKTMLRTPWKECSPCGYGCYTAQSTTACILERRHTAMSAQHVSSPGAKISCCNQSFDLRPTSSDSQIDSQDRCHSFAPHYKLFLSCEIFGVLSLLVSILAKKVYGRMFRKVCSHKLKGKYQIPVYHLKENNIERTGERQAYSTQNFQAVVAYTYDTSTQKSKAGRIMDYILLREALIALPENRASNPSTHQAAPAICNTNSREFSIFFWYPKAPDIYVVHRNTCKQNTHTHKNNKNK